MSLAAAALLLLMAALSKPETSAKPADLVLLSARIWTADPTRAEATALAARDGRIVAVVVLSRDPLSIPKSKLDTVKVDATIVGGRIVFSR
jgi:predicted amidohydrolase YtcJ